MLENEEGVEKLKVYLRKKFPQLSDSEIEKIAPNLYELGLFLVRLKVKEHSKQSKPQNAEGFEHITEKPP